MMYDRQAIIDGLNLIIRRLSRLDGYGEEIEAVKDAIALLTDEEHDPHKVSEVICVKCGKRWVAVRPVSTLLRDLECPECGEAGYAIETGEEIIDED